VVVDATPAPAPAVVVVDDELLDGDVVVVSLPPGAVLLVVVPAVVVVVVVEGVVEVGVVEVVVVGVVAGVGVGLTRLCKVVPVSAPPKMADRGLPEISSTAVIRSRASTNTVTAPTAMVRQEKPGRAVARTDVAVGVADAVSSVAGASAAAEISRRWVSAAGAADDAVSTVWASLSCPPAA
jgi:hypothetical protein